MIYWHFVIFVLLLFYYMSVNRVCLYYAPRLVNCAITMEVSLQWGHSSNFLCRSKSACKINIYSSIQCKTQQNSWLVNYTIHFVQMADINWPPAFSGYININRIPEQFHFLVNLMISWASSTVARTNDSLAMQCDMELRLEKGRRWVDGYGKWDSGAVRADRV